MKIQLVIPNTIIGDFSRQDPIKVKPWSTTFDATAEKTGCIHFSIRWHMITGTEDCLYNNIHTPEVITSIFRYNTFHFRYFHLQR